MTGEDGLSRWARRKAEARAAARAGTPPEAPAPAEPQAVEAPDERSDEELLEELGLPEPETLGKGDDFGPYLRDAIPTRLRNRALRRLWRTNPALANLDALVDYGEDFTDSAVVVENLQTVYQVGRGMVERLTKPAEEDEAPEAIAAEEEPEPAAAAAAPEADPAAAAAAETEGDGAGHGGETLAAKGAVEAETAPPPAPRPRIRFTFDET